MAQRDPRTQLIRALSAHRSADSNQKALVYAPWVLNCMLLVVLRENANQLEVKHWIGFGIYVIVLVALGNCARRALAKQRERAENDVLLLIQTERGFEELQRLQSQGRFRQVRFTDTVRQRIIDAGIRQARAQEDRRDQASRRAQSRDSMLARV